MKKSVVLTLCLVAFLGIMTGCGKKDSYKNMVADNTVIIKEEKTVEKLKFSRATLVYDGEKTYVVIDVANETNSDIELSAIKISFYKDDKLIDEVSTYIGDRIETKTNKQIKVNYPGDLSNVNKINYSVIK